MRNDYHTKQSGTSSFERKTQKDFYFANSYPGDSRKKQAMQGNVLHDLKPFTGYIDASIDHIKKATADGADVRIVKNIQEQYLVPNFTLIKPKLTGASFVVSKPQDIYMLNSDEEFDTESFEVVRRRDIICSHSDKLCTYKGTVFVKKDLISVNTDGKFDLYDNGEHHAESIKCTVSPVQYGNSSSYQISGISIESVEERENELVIHTNADISSLESIEILGESYPVLRKENVSKTDITGNDVTVKPVSDTLYAITPAIPDNKRHQLSANSKELDYDIIKIEDFPEDELQDLLQTKEVSVKNKRLVYTGDEEKNVVFAGFSFGIRSEKLPFRKQLRDKSGKLIGTIIEVLTDDKSIGDLESNTDMFFKETTERLTDSLPFQKGRNRSFRIGRTDENQSLLEIAEETQNGQLIQIDKLPNHLYAVPNCWQLEKQKAAIIKLQEMPCKEQSGLLELFERKASPGQFGAKWSDITPSEVRKWYILTDDSYDGCTEQREFVKKALATDDFAFLDGPPGSGKTTVLLELISQLVMQGKKVLLTASTNAAVDNILERLDKLPKDVHEKILAVRLGNEGSISETVSGYTLAGVPVEFCEEITRRANLVCGTIFGVLKHPEFNLNDRSQPVRPLYDYLIIDEASKTTFQDFLIPALYSRHWVLSGDLKQLTPYVEQDTVQSSIEEIPEFDRNMQRIQTILWLAKDNNKIAQINMRNMRFYIIVPSDQAVAAERLITDDSALVGIITKYKSDCPYAASLQEIKDAETKSAILYGARILIIDEAVREEAKKLIPADFVPMFDVEQDDRYKDLFLTASTEYFFAAKKPKVDLGSYWDKTTYSTWKDIAKYWTNAVKEHSWAQEMTWRMCRIQELFLDSDRNKTVERYKHEIEKRMPSDPDMKDKVRQYCAALTGIALPSILQLLQNGLSEDVKKNFKQTTLNSGFEKEEFDSRHTMLTYQHRMHPAISAFSADKIYHGEALKDGTEMDQNRSWNCPLFDSHDVWLDYGTGNAWDCRNENQKEVCIIKERIRSFMRWTESNPNSDKDSKGNWSVACLTYYKRQERMLKQAVKELFGEQREKSWYKNDEKHIEVFIYTVDKFQGREADVVFLSLIKTGNAPLGFMDSPNRLNVALTRARYQRVIVGSKHYFRNNKKSELLKNLAEDKKRR